jgi:hypothetical protein
MQAQPILISWTEEFAGHAVSPTRVPLAWLRTFSKDVDEFVRGGADGVDTAGLEVAVVAGSLAIQTTPVSNASLLADLHHLSSSEKIDLLAPSRRAVVERWQKKVRSARGARFEISAPMLGKPIVISITSDYRADDADQWVRVERYVRGEIEDLGGSSSANAHIRLSDGTRLTVDTDRDMLRDDKLNRLYKQAMVRITAEYNVITRAYRKARLIAFIEHDRRVDERELARLFERGAKAWAGVPEAAVWVDSLRGNTA